MRVLLVHNRYRSSQPSGENAVVEDEARLLSEHGCAVEQLVTESDAIAGWGLRKRATLPLRVVWSREGYRLTVDSIRRFRPDVVHFHNTFPLLSPSALWAARGSGCAVVMTLHNFRPLCPAGTFFRDGHVCEECLGRWPVPAVVHGCYRESRLATGPVAAMNSVHRLLDTWLRCVDRFIVPSQFTKLKYVEAGWPEERFVVKYNTVPDPGISRTEVPAGFVCLSRLGPEKGIEILLKAWAEAFPHGEENVLIIGSGECETALKDFGEDLPGVTFLSQLERAQALTRLSLARALVIPSQCYEVFPRTVVEAYSLGVPVVASRIGSLTELVDDGRTGLLFETGSRTELAHSLQTVARSSELVRVLGSGARRAYERLYHPDSTTAALLAIYDEARARPPVSRVATVTTPAEHS